MKSLIVNWETWLFRYQSTDGNNQSTDVDQSWVEKVILQA